MYEKIRIFISSNEFALIDKVLLWYCNFYKNHEKEHKTSLIVAKQLIHKLDKYAGLGYIEITNSELHYLINSCEYERIEEAFKCEELDKLIEKTKGYKR